MQKRVTIKDVAKEAGVSKSTVSLVIQDSNLIKKETTEKVKAAIAKLGYVYNRAAASLRSDGVGLVGLVVNDLRNPFHTELSIAVQMRLAEMGYITVIANTGESNKLQSKIIHSMLEHDVSALIICPAVDSEPEIFDMLRQRELPTVLVSRDVQNQKDPLPLFSFDYVSGGHIATEHLIDQGCKKIAFVGGYETTSVTKNRIAGYAEVIRECGVDSHVFHGRPTRRFGQEIVEEIITQHPDIDGLYCFNDLVALGCLQQLLKMGVAVGKDIKVVGFDDIENSSHSEPPLSSIHCDLKGIGTELSAYIVDWIKQGKMPESVDPWAVKLMARESSLGRDAVGASEELA